MERLYAKVKKSRIFENDYLSLKEDLTNARKCLYKVFDTIKELINNKNQDETCCFVDSNKISLNYTDYDLTFKHSYHFENLYIAIDSVIALYEPYFKTYKINCEIIDGCVYLCEKCDTFLL